MRRAGIRLTVGIVARYKLEPRKLRTLDRNGRDYRTRKESKRVDGAVVMFGRRKKGRGETNRYGREPINQRMRDVWRLGWPTEMTEASACK